MTRLATRSLTSLAFMVVLLLAAMTAALPSRDAAAVTPTYYYLPDLTFTSASAFTDGEAAPWVSFTVKNRGAIDAAAFTVVVRDHNGVIVGSKRIAGLRAGASISTSLLTSGGSLSLNCKAPYQLMVDGNRELNEQNESNNFITACQS